MTAMEQNLNTIKTAVYGRDMRNSIYECIDELNQNVGDLSVSVNEGYPVSTVEAAVDNWGKNNAASFIASGSLTKDKFKKGAVVDPKPNYQQVLSLPLKRIRDSEEQNRPIYLQGMTFVNSNIAIITRKNYLTDDSHADAVAINLTTGEYTTHDLGNGLAGHANCIAYHDNMLYVATGTNSQNTNKKGIAVYSCPTNFFGSDNSIEYLRTYEFENHENIWSVVYDEEYNDGAGCFYIAGWKDGSKNGYNVYRLNSLDEELVEKEDEDDETTSNVLFTYPTFFTNGMKSDGVLAYYDGMFYIAKHDPNNIARLDYRGNLIDVAEFPQDGFGELEQIAFRNGKLCAATQVTLYSYFINNIYEVDYIHSYGQTDLPYKKYATTVYVNQDNYSNIRRDGTESNPFCCIEEALYCTQGTWAHKIIAQSDIDVTKIEGTHAQIDCRYTRKDNNGNTITDTYKIKQLNITNSYVLIENGIIDSVVYNDDNTVNTSESKDVALRLHNSSVSLSNTYLNGLTFDVNGDGILNTDMPIGNAKVVGIISGLGAAATVNKYYDTGLTNGFVSVGEPVYTYETVTNSETGEQTLKKTEVKGSLTFNTNRVGSTVMIVLSGYQNQQSFVLPYTSLVGSLVTSGDDVGKKTKTITRYGTLSYNVNVRDSEGAVVRDPETNELLYEIVVCKATYTFNTVEYDGTLTIEATVSFYNDDSETAYRNIDHKTAEAIGIWAATF